MSMYGAPSDRDYLESVRGAEPPVREDQQEPWEHDMTQLYASLGGIAEAARTSVGREARILHHQLVQLERDLMAVTQIAAQRMDKE